MKEVKICLLKNPKHKLLAKHLAMAFRQKMLGTKAEQANVVQAKPKPFVRNPSSFNSKSCGFVKLNAAGKDSTMSNKKKHVGIVFKPPVRTVVAIFGKSYPVVGEKGKGKALLKIMEPIVPSLALPRGRKAMVMMIASLQL